MFVPVCLLCKHSVLRVSVISTSLISDYKVYFGSPDGLYLHILKNAFLNDFIIVHFRAHSKYSSYFHHKDWCLKYTPADSISTC